MLYLQLPLSDSVLMEFSLHTVADSGVQSLQAEVHDRHPTRNARTQFPGTSCNIIIFALSSKRFFCLQLRVSFVAVAVRVFQLRFLVAAAAVILVILLFVLAPVQWVRVIVMVVLLEENSTNLVTSLISLKT
jgi:hypothetical protein